MFLVWRYDRIVKRDYIIENSYWVQEISLSESTIEKRSKTCRLFHMGLEERNPHDPDRDAKKFGFDSSRFG